MPAYGEQCGNSPGCGTTLAEGGSLVTWHNMRTAGAVRGPSSFSTALFVFPKRKYTVWLMNGFLNQLGTRSQGVCWGNKGHPCFGFTRTESQRKRSPRNQPRFAIDPFTLTCGSPWMPETGNGIMRGKTCCPLVL